MPWPALPDVDYSQSTAVHPSQLVEPISHRDLDDVDGGGHVTVALKTASQSVTSSTTLQDDDHLFFAVKANEAWLFEAALIVNGDTAGDLKLAFTWPTGAGCRWFFQALADTATGPVGDLVSDGSATSGGAPTYNIGINNTRQTLVIVKGYVAVGATAGTVQLQWAQAVSSATATHMRTESHLIGRRVA